MNTKYQRQKEIFGWYSLHQIMENKLQSPTLNLTNKSEIR